MKIFKKLVVVFLLIIIGVIGYNYRKLNIMSGYSAKIMSSSVFVAERGVEFTNVSDANFSPINLVDDVVDFNAKTVKASVYGLKEREAVFREGLGCVLVGDDYDKSLKLPVPKRSQVSDTIPFPYGNGESVDSIFSTINYHTLNKAVNGSFDSIASTRSVIVVYKNHIVAEKYAEGFDENSKLLGWSMTKSLLGSFYGVLSSQGKISVNDKAAVKEWANDDRAQITINNLLQMSSGLEWEEDYEIISDATKMLFLEEDMSLTQRVKSLVHEPGAVFNYSSGTSNLLSGILRDQFKTHKDYLDFIYTDFIDKIGMNSAIIEADLAGNYVASSYGWASTRDWAKLGLLYLHRGNWNGRQIFDSEWVDYVTTPAVGSEGKYGAQFWLNKNGYMPDVPTDVYSANGFQGQRIFIFPSHDLVVVRMGLKKIDFNLFLKEVFNSIKKP